VWSLNIPWQKLIVVKKDHEENYLGVLFSTVIKFSHHIVAAANKTNRVIGTIRRSFQSMDKLILCRYSNP